MVAVAVASAHNELLCGRAVVGGGGRPSPLAVVALFPAASRARVEVEKSLSFVVVIPL